MVPKLFIHEEYNPQIGDECITSEGDEGYYDCELCCWENWIFYNNCYKFYYS